jgi:hypothetical protein
MNLIVFPDPDQLSCVLSLSEFASKLRTFEMLTTTEFSKSSGKSFGTSGELKIYCFMRHNFCAFRFERQGHPVSYKPSQGASNILRWATLCGLKPSGV